MHVREPLKEPNYSFINQSVICVKQLFIENENIFLFAGISSCASCFSQLRCQWSQTWCLHTIFNLNAIAKSISEIESDYQWIMASKWVRVKAIIWCQKGCTSLMNYFHGETIIFGQKRRPWICQVTHYIHQYALIKITPHSERQRNQRSSNWLYQRRDERKCYSWAPHICYLYSTLRFHTTLAILHSMLQHSMHGLIRASFRWAALCKHKLHWLCMNINAVISDGFFLI